jgi:1-acyl-sn-glycerol-3-phosphate acyltransferase
MGFLYLVVLRPLVFLRHPGSREARQRFARRFLRAMAAGLLRFFPYRDSDRLYLGADPAAFQPPAVIVSNHLARFDIMVVLALPTEMVMLVKEWVWKAPIMGRLIRDAGYLRMVEGEPEAFLSRGAELLAQGVSVMVFPEATRSPDGRMHRFHKGAFELAVRTGSDVLPVLLSNTQACTPRGAFWVGDHRVVIRVLPRVTPQTFDYTQGSRELGRHVKTKLLAQVDEDWRLAQQGRAFRHNIRSLYRYRGAYAEHYVAWKLRIDPIFEHADDFLPHEGLVLDLGCGYGLMANVLARKSRRRQVIGVDFDERKIAVARATAAASENVAFELADLFAWRGPEADAAILVDVAHYWDLEHQRRLIARAAASLREGGTLLFRDLADARTWRHRLTAATERFAALSGHNRAGQGLHYGTREFYLRAFAEAGLTLCAEPAQLNVGSNYSAVLRKGLPCEARRAEEGAP